LKRFNNIIRIDSHSPQPEWIEKAVEAILNGNIIVFPTSCLYGLAADAWNPVAVQKIFQAKQRPETNPLLVLVKNQKAVASLVNTIPPVAVLLMEKFWPGKLTIVFEAKGSLPGTLTAGTGKIGIRIPEHKVAAALVNALENPITGTSANLSSEKGCSHISELHPAVARYASLILDAGLLKGGLGSTVIDVTVTPPVILREGMVSAKKIQQVVETAGLEYE